MIALSIAADICVCLVLFPKQIQLTNIYVHFGGISKNYYTVYNHFARHIDIKKLFYDFSF